MSNETVAPSQTLDRGLAILELVALADSPVSIAMIASSVGLHRSIAYRLIRTLEMRSLVERDERGDYRPAVGLALLARSVRVDLRRAAAPELRRLCDTFGLTAFVVVRDGDEAVTVDSAEPTISTVHLVYRPGTRHRVDLGAPGLALLMGTAAAEGERTALTEARSRGWARTAGEVLPAMSAIAAPVAGFGACAGAIAVMWLTGQPVDEAAIGPAVVSAASVIAAQLS